MLNDQLCIILLSTMLRYKILHFLKGNIKMDFLDFLLCKVASFNLDM